MDTARWNGVAVAASDFHKESKRHDNQWLAENRKGFTCLVCGEHASYVSPGLGPQGRAPHFRVKGTTDCDQHRPTETKQDHSVPAPEAKEGVVNEGGVVDVRYDQLAGPGTAAAISGIGGKPPAESSSRVHYVASGGAPTSRSSSNLRTFLAYLRADDSYPPPTSRLNVPERGEVNATDYFCSFDDVMPAHADPLPDTNRPRLMAYWGVITSTVEMNCTFLKGSNMDVMIYPRHWPDFVAALGIASPQDVVGWHILAEGRLGMSQAKRPILKVGDLNRLALLPPR